MRPSVARLIPVTVAFLTFANGAAAVDTVWPPATVPRQVNITSDSAPGWAPSVQDEAEMRAAVGKFLAAKDGGQATEAYAMLSDLEKAHQPFADFASALRVFNHQAGAVLERRAVAINWTKNPAQAPLPGIYAAVDIVSRFAEIERDCGFLILYQSPSGGDYRIMREEDNILDNATARTM